MKISIGTPPVDTLVIVDTGSDLTWTQYIAFGCGRSNGGMFSNATSGFIGLGRGNSTNPNATSHINFGDNAVVSGPGVVSTPLFTKVESTLYRLNLTAISLGNKRVEYIFSESSGNHQGNTIIDSGTALTFIPDFFYASLEILLIHSIKATRKDDPSGAFNLCYEPKENVISMFQRLSIILQMRI
ncbi:hypothetical protein CQW23_18359 [Capsicum baccatum]|uniref:Peptidase A1 domain-containing protein n=1 Tax=Capsicum baccatum TaxID=33114 RepID=A0A2G2W2Q6_CAPBA|nr:hypothetical protein CQW23_18359 [Capsicum baccatum]